jgi:2-methylcitrate dehydratase
MATPTAPAHTGPTLADKLADYTLQLTYDAIPQPVIQETKRRILDSLGCAMGAFSSDPARIARMMADSATSTHGSTVIGRTGKTVPGLAAFANGILFRYLDFNDTYLSKEPAHPSDNIAAVLAGAEPRKSPGKDILAAIVLAYEVQCRLCDAASIRAKGWDHVTYGNFSATLGVGKLYGLDKKQLVHAQGIAATTGNAMRQTRVGELSNWKGCAFASTSRNAVFSAALAMHGMTGPAPIFEGEMGFFNQISECTFDLPTLGGVDAAPFMMTRTYVKHFPVEYHAQSAVEAALTLRERILAAGQSIDAISAIDIDSFDAAVDIIAGFAEHWDPQNRETADHSMPYCVAAALMDGNITLGTFELSRIRDPQLLALVQKIKVHRHPEMNAGYPKGIPNRLTAQLANGQTLVERVDYPLGHAENPMTDADIEAKFRGLAEPVLSQTTISKVLDLVWSFESQPSVTPLLEAFAADLGQTP